MSYFLRLSETQFWESQTKLVKVSRLFSRIRLVNVCLPLASHASAAVLEQNRKKQLAVRFKKNPDYLDL